MDVHRRRFVGNLAAFLVSAGCRRAPPPSSGKTHATRVVSLSPSTTEALFSVDAGKQVVGRSRFCDYPPEASQLPSVGGYVDASLEAILALAPDLVVGDRGPAGPALAQKLGALGIDTFFPRTETMAEIDAMIVDLATTVGKREQGLAVVEKLKARRRDVSAAVSGEPRPRVLLVFGITPIVVAGPQSFPHEMIVLANGENVITAGGAYPTLNVERLLTLKPDVVINAAVAGAASNTQSGIRSDDPGWRELRAVREGRIVPLTDPAVLRPGPRIGDGLATLARALHPKTRIP
jgi:iron complex transport system substrate-binding protein